MQHIIKQLTIFIVLLLVAGLASAQQHGDSVHIIRIEKDSLNKERIYWEKIAKDSIKRMVYERNAQVYQLGIEQRKAQHKSYGKLDLFKAEQLKNTRLFDSLRMSKRYRDTAYSKIQHKNYRLNDSLGRLKSYTLHKRMDSLKGLSYQHDSGYALQHKVYRTQDSLNRKNKFVLMKKYDSIRIREIKLRLKKDSANMRQYIEYLKKDSALRLYKPREVTMEIPAEKGLLFIDNTHQDIVIKNGDSRTIRLVTKVQDREDQKLSDKQWFEKMKVQLMPTDSGISLRVNAGAVRIEKKSVSSAGYTSSSLVLVQKTDTARPLSPRSALYIFIPADTKLKIVSRYADVKIDDGTTDVTVKINNGKLQMDDAARAVIDSRYGSVNANKLGQANIAIINGSFKCESVNDLQVDSKYSQMDFGKVVKLSMKSLSDRYMLQQVSYLEGNKNFGQLTINNLSEGMVLNASSADINVKTIATGARLVKITNRYAELRLPVSVLTNYAISFEGVKSRLFSKPSIANNNLPVLTALNQNSFTASMGNLSGLHTKLQLDCNSCVVDLR